MTHVSPDAEIVGTFPCTRAQERFWFLDQVHKGSAANNIAVQWELRGTFDAATVEAAFQSVVDRHEILRTRFVEADGIPVQEVVDRVTFRLGRIDVRSLPEAERAARIERIAADIATRPFDLGQPCPLRVSLVRFAPDRAMLLVAVHHAVFDGFSIRVLGREVGAALAAAASGAAPALPELAIQYGDYATWLAACRDGEDFAVAGRYWKERLEGISYFELPADRPRRPLGLRRGARLRQPLPGDFADRLAEAARRAGTSAFGYGAAVFAAALHRFTGEGDISFGTAVAGRVEPELEDLIGVFINPVVLRVGLDGDATLPAAIDAAQEVVRGALAHAAYPFDDIVKDLRLRADALRTPAVSVFFALQKVFLEEQRYGGVELKSVPSLAPEITHDLNLQILGRDSGWHMIVDYDADRFDESTVGALAELVQRCFDLAFAGDTRTLASLPLEAGARVADAVPVPALSLVSAPAADWLAPVEQRLAALWGDVLGLDPTSCDGDFFDLGGGSLLALRMMVRVQEAFGVRPDIADFLRAPTLRGFARHVEALLGTPGGGGDAADWSLIQLRQGAGDRPLLVTVNQPFLYGALARRLDHGMGVVNLHLRGPEVLESGGARLGALVDEARSLILATAAGRPVILMGHCVDGTVALMIGQSMAAAGSPAALVSMIDTWRPGFVGATGVARRLRRQGKRLRRWGQYIGQRLRGRIGWTEFLGKSTAVRRLLVRLGRIEPPTPDERREWAVNALLQTAVREADIRSYAGEVLVFRTASQRQEARDLLFGWGGHLPADTPVFDLPGWHEDALLKHGIDRIADVLASRAARVQVVDTPRTALRQRARG